MANTYQIPELDIGATVPVEFAYTVTDADVSDGLTITATASTEGAETSASITPELAKPAALTFETATWLQIKSGEYGVVNEDVGKTRPVVLKDGLGEGNIRLYDTKNGLVFGFDFATVPIGSSFTARDACMSQKTMSDAFIAMIPDDLSDVIDDWGSSYLGSYKFSSMAEDQINASRYPAKAYEYFVESPGKDARIKPNLNGNPCSWVLTDYWDDDVVFVYVVDSEGNIKDDVRDNTRLSESLGYSPVFKIIQGGGLSNLLGLLMAAALMQRISRMSGGVRHG